MLLKLEIDCEGWLEMKLYDKKDVSIFPLWTFHLYVATFHISTCIWSIYLSVHTIFQSLWFLSGFLWWWVAANKEPTEPKVLGGKVAIITSKVLTWLTITEYLCHKWPRICSTYRKHFQVLFISGFVARVKRRMP